MAVLDFNSMTIYYIRKKIYYAETVYRSNGYLMTQ